MCSCISMCGMSCTEVMKDRTHVCVMICCVFLHIHVIIMAGFVCMQPKVSGMVQAANEQLGTSAASRSQLLLRQLQQKYATSQQPSRPDMGRKGLPQKSFDQQLQDVRPPSELEASRIRSCNIARPKLSKPAVGKLTPISDSRHTAAPRVAGVVPIRTRAQGGRRRRK